MKMCLAVFYLSTNRMGGEDETESGIAELFKVCL